MSAQAINLLPDFSRWVALQVMTQDEALELQAIFGMLRVGESAQMPDHLQIAMQSLGLHQLLDETTATRH